MQIHQLQPKHKSKNRKKVGRGGKKGTYSGRGNKGQSARAGRKMVPMIRELIKRYPKLKGYRREVIESHKLAVNLGILDKKFSDGETVSPAILSEKGIVRTIKGKLPQVKILGGGELKKKLFIENCAISDSAKKAVEKAGGTIK